MLQGSVEREEGRGGTCRATEGVTQGRDVARSALVRGHKGNCVEG